VIQARFGTDSFRKHLDAAEFRGIPFAEVRIPELAYDLDRPEDVLEVIARGGRGRTRATCLELGLAERLSVRVE
jgi:2-phospho-L-lactate guanylyltransferase (CobY/MobA/RfbA family)